MHHHFDGLPESDRSLLHQILHELKELKIMSGTNSAAVNAAFADISTALDAIGTDVTNISADVDTLLAGMTPGDPVTQAMVDTANSLRDRVAAIKTGLDAVDAKVPPAAVP